MALSPGDVIDGKYRIVGLLGEGGMGAVYEGENIRIRHRVAIKVLHAAIAANPQVVDRFEREAQAAGEIGSEHIVEVLDLGALPNGEHYMVMEFLSGESLAKRLAGRGRLSPAELLTTTHQLLEGLDAAHGAGIVHRDLKPENVFLQRSRGGTRDFVKVLDFGISKFNQSNEGKSSTTRTGSVMGTPTYMSPEQAKGSRDIDRRTDLYAVGVMLYECLTGEAPFVGETVNEVLFKHVLETPRALSELLPGIDPNFVAIVEKAMAKDREQRFQTAKEFQQALSDCAQAAGVSLIRGSASSWPPALSGATPGTGSAPRFGTQPTQSSDPALAPPRPGTVGSWATSGVGRLVTLPGSGKRVPLVLLLAGAALAVSLLGGLGLIFALRSRTPDQPVLATPSAAVQNTPAPRAETPRPATAERETPRASAVPSASPSAKKRAVKGGLWRAPPAPAAKSAPPSSATGRKIYTEL